VKAVAPSLPVFGGSLVGSNGKFLQALYDDGIEGSYDGLAVHYYDLVLPALGSIRQTQTRNGDSAPLWLTEFGWTGCEQANSRHQIGGHACVSDQLQAGNLLDVFRGLRPVNYVQAAVVYELRDGLGGSANFGLETAGGKHKQSFGAVQKAFAARQGTARKPTLKLGKTASGTAPAGDVVTVSIFRAGAKKATSSVTVAPNRNQQYAVKLPKSVRKGGWLVQALQPFTGKRTEKST
jgi:hypothetical protein